MNYILNMWFDIYVELSFEGACVSFRAAPLSVTSIYY